MFFNLPFTYTALCTTWHPPPPPQTKSPKSSKTKTKEKTRDIIHNTHPCSARTPFIACFMQYTSWNTWTLQSPPRVYRRLYDDRSLTHTPSSDGTPALHHDQTQILVSQTQSHSSSHGSTETQPCSRIEASCTSCFCTKLRVKTIHWTVQHAKAKGVPHQPLIK